MLWKCKPLDIIFVYYSSLSLLLLFVAHYKLLYIATGRNQQIRDVLRFHDVLGLTCRFDNVERNFHKEPCGHGTDRNPLQSFSES